MSGYDIKKRIDATISYFWGAGFGQIYPTLKSLEQDGFVTKRTEEGENGQNRIVYSITQCGRDELARWLAVPAQKENVKYELLLKLFFGRSQPLEQNIGKISDFRSRTAGSLKTMELYKESLQECLAEEDHLYYYLTVLFGQQVFKAYMAWADEAVRLLEELKKDK